MDATTREREAAANIDRYVLVTSDSHAGPPQETFVQYFEPKYRETFTEHLTAHSNTVVSAMAEDPAAVFAEFLDMPAEAAEAFARHPTLQPGGHPGLKDAKHRIADLDGEGIAADVIYPDFTSNNSPPFGAGLGRINGDVDLAYAGARAYNRWLADFCSEQPHRHAGIAVAPANDPDRCVAEIRWAHGAGLRGGWYLPSRSDDLPGYNDPFYEPIWAACEELGMPVNTHVGNELPDYGTRPESFALSQTEMLFFGHRPLWWLMWGGVFEDHPQLKFVLAEQDAYWVPQVLAELETVFDSHFAGPGLRQRLHSRPREYWGRQCYVAATMLSRPEAEKRADIGLGNILWGADYPHLESTWPYTTKTLRATFAAVPTDEVARMVGGNAIDVYGFDAAKLAAVADQIGPTAAEVATAIDPSEYPTDYVGEGFRDPPSHRV